VDQCAFEGNVGSSADQSFGSGGGLSQSGGSGSVSNSIFISNTVGGSRHGGGAKSSRPAAVASVPAAVHCPLHQESCQLAQLLSARLCGPAVGV
jgi:hypothetical protein